MFISNPETAYMVQEYSSLFSTAFKISTGLWWFDISLPTSLSANVLADPHNTTSAGLLPSVSLYFEPNPFTWSSQA